MLLAKNGWASSSKWTHHMNICYFFVMDRIQAGDIWVEYCPTDDMIADFFTKPLQGSKFIRFRDQILNVYPVKGVCSTGGPHTAGPPRSATMYTTHGGLQDRGGGGRADCRALFGVIAVAFVDGKRNNHPPTLAPIHYLERRTWQLSSLSQFIY